jgi:hypothetical protein
MKIKLLLTFALIIISSSTAFSIVRTKSKLSAKSPISVESVTSMIEKCRTDSRADNCRSVAQIFSDVYDKWGAVIIATGCVVAVNAGTGGVAMAATLNCIKNAKKYAEAVEKMVKFFNENAGNSRWKIGPRQIEWGKVQTGTVVSATSRVFVSAAPVDKDSVTIKVKKIEGKAQTDIIICKVDEKGNFIKLAQVEFAKGDDNEGQTITKTVSGVKGHLVQVRVDSDSVAKKFEYQLTVTK